MAPELLPVSQVLMPAILVIGGIWLLGPLLPIERPWARYGVFAFVWFVVAWYLHWRLRVTILPATGTWYELAWLWFCFAVELFALLDQFIHYLTFLRVTYRSAEADRYEALLHALPPSRRPSVDVFIPTINEPLEVLERTIVGALCLDYDKVKIWVLDDGRRPWLKDFCEQKGVGYLTRPDNRHAKAGNINHALRHTDGDLVAIFDADFVPQRNFLARTVGFFADPAIGVVQTPQAFYNFDPMQRNLALYQSMPDEQRFFYDAIMPSRDAWDAAFCCGSNSLSRRAALETIGGALPTESITEDMLLTLVLLRKRYLTHYLDERLAYGLAPESVDAFFVQRERWALGAVQILYLANGPFGRGLGLMQRLLFLPTYWLSIGIRSMMAVAVVLVYSWTDLSPLFDVGGADVVHYILPMVLALLGGTWLYAPRQYAPLASLVHGLFLSFRMTPKALVALLTPSGHIFQVTPKGAASQGLTYARDIFWPALVLIILTFLGLMMNAVPEWRIIHEPAALPVLAVCSAINILALFLVCMMSLHAPKLHSEEAMPLDEPIWIVGTRGTISPARTRSLSLAGVEIRTDADRPSPARAGDKIRVFVAEVGFVDGCVIRQWDNALAIRFSLPQSVERDLLIRKLFTGGLCNKHVETSAWRTTWALAMSIWRVRADIVDPSEADSAEALFELPAEPLPARSLAIPPKPPAAPLAELVKTRQTIAA